MSLGSLLAHLPCAKYEKPNLPHAVAYVKLPLKEVDFLEKKEKETIISEITAFHERFSKSLIQTETDDGKAICFRSRDLCLMHDLREMICLLPNQSVGYLDDKRVFLKYPYSANSIRDLTKTIQSNNRKVTIFLFMM